MGFVYFNFEQPPLLMTTSLTDLGLSITILCLSDYLYSFFHLHCKYIYVLCASFVKGQLRMSKSDSLDWIQSKEKSQYVNLIKFNLVLFF